MICGERNWRVGGSVGGRVPWRRRRRSIERMERVGLRGEGGVCLGVLIGDLLSVLSLSFTCICMTIDGSL